MVPKSTGDVLTQATFRLKEYKNMRIDKIIKVGLFKHTLHKEVMSTLPECFMGIDVMPDLEHFPYQVL